jgi:hypothetical protein
LRVLPTRVPLGRLPLRGTGPLRSGVPLVVKDEDAEEIATPTQRFSPLGITNGLPGDSREAAERAAERRLRHLRGGVKATRAVPAATPGLAETLTRDGRTAGRFDARFGVTEAQVRDGVPGDSTRNDEGASGLSRPCTHASEAEPGPRPKSFFTAM